MLSVYTPGTSVIHRAPPVIKLLALCVSSLGVSIAVASPLAALGAVLTTIVLYALAGLGLRCWLRETRRFAFILALVTVSQLLFGTPAGAAVHAGRIATLILLGMLVTLTTSPAVMIDAIERALRPLSRVGVDGGRVALALMLVLTAIPVVHEIVRRVHEAHRARGLRPSWRSTVPVLIAVFGYADDLGDALLARGENDGRQVRGGIY